MGRFNSWVKKLPTIAKVGAITGSSFLLLMGVVGATASSNHSSSPKPNTGNHQEVKAESTETKTETTTATVPFTSSTTDDSNLAQGSTKVKTAGVNGSKTQTWTITLTNGKETNRKLTSEVITTQPVNEVVLKGTYVAPAPSDCPNGTYVNTAGNVVCSPYSAPSTPTGATARCRDGTYSFSQSRSGTCSHHGGVAEWL